MKVLTMSKIEYTDDKYINVESLMYGDLVVMKGHIVRVSGITGGCLRCATGNRIDDNETVISSLVERIPLTLEMLQKNSFEFRPDMMAKYHLNVYSNDGVDIIVFPDESFGFNWHGKGDCKYSSVNIEFKYVHELQHALRVCEIDKDIEI